MGLTSGVLKIAIATYQFTSYALRWKDLHSRNGIRSTKPLSPPFPSHGFMMTAFSGCNAACSGLVSIMITLLRSRFKYERS